MRIVNVRTEKEATELANLMKRQGYRFSDKDMNTFNRFDVYKSNTCIKIESAPNSWWYSPKSFYQKKHPQIPIETFTQYKQSMKQTKKVAPKKVEKKKLDIVYQFKTTTKTRWQIIRVGKEYMTRHVSPNGNVLAINPKQFNNAQNAFKNIKANASASLIPIAAKKGEPTTQGIGGYLKCCK